jgi:hypothetical protein
VHWLQSVGTGTAVMRAHAMALLMLYACHCHCHALMDPTAARVLQHLLIKHVA